jgi:hypothetical protein
MTLIGRTVGAGRRNRRDQKKPAANERESTRIKKNDSPQIAQMERRSGKTKTSPLMNTDDTDQKRQISPLRRGEDQIANQKPKASSQQPGASGPTLLQ